MNRSFRVNTLCLSVVLAALTVACGEDVVSPDPVVISEIRVIRGENQFGVVDTFLDSAITFEVLGSTGERYSATILVALETDGALHGDGVRASGIGPHIGLGITSTASVEWKLGTTAGMHRLRAIAYPTNSLFPDTVEVTVVAYAGPDELSHIVQLGNNQSGDVGAALPLPVGVELSDRFGNGIQYNLVTWSVTGGGGSLSADTISTDATGRADVTWTLGAAAGAQSVLAEIEGGGSVVFSATAH